MLLVGVKANKETGVSCHGCGKCCVQGGPPLHRDDISLLESSVLRPDNLVTIRRGELGLQPGQTMPTPVEREFVKIKGQGASWVCLFYNVSAKKCLIHKNKPYSCRMFFCQKPDDLLAISGKELLNRFMLLGDNKLFCRLLLEHEDKFPCPDLVQLADSLARKEERRELLLGLSTLVNNELVFRQNICRQYNIDLAWELFYFGRPLFQLLLPLGVEIEENNGYLTLR